MRLIEMERDVIKPLSRLEKLQLIADITKMLQEEEEIDQNVSRYFQKGVVYPVFTPLGMEEAAAQLQDYLDRGEL